MGKYFTVEVSPAFNATSVAAFGAGNLLFDWTAFQIPKGAAKLVSLGVIMRGTDGGVQTAKDIDFYFGKSINGVAPTSFGTSTAVQPNIMSPASISAPLLSDTSPAIQSGIKSTLKYFPIILFFYFF